MFKETQFGLVYVGSDGLQYELLEGKTTSNHTSDIVFILDNNIKDKPQGVIVDFLYGGFEELEWIKETIEKYIREKGEK